MSVLLLSCKTVHILPESKLGGGSICMTRVSELFGNARRSFVARALMQNLHAAPNLARDLDAEFQLAPLLVLGQQVAVLGAGEAALRAERQLFQRQVFAGRVDAAF